MNTLIRTAGPRGGEGRLGSWASPLAIPLISNHRHEVAKTGAPLGLASRDFSLSCNEINVLGAIFCNVVTLELVGGVSPGMRRGRFRGKADRRTTACPW